MTQTNYVNTRGLDFIKSSTFTNASSISVDNCFSATYGVYKIVINADCNVTKNWMMRMRVGGVDNSSSQYNYQYIDANDTTLIASRSTTATWFNDVFYGQANVNNLTFLEISNPFQAITTTGSLIRTISSSGNIILELFSYSMDVTTSYDGFTLHPENATSSPVLTGSLYVYGYVNS